MQTENLHEVRQGIHRSVRCESSKQCCILLQIEPISSRDVGTVNDPTVATRDRKSLQTVDVTSIFRLLFILNATDQKV